MKVSSTTTLPARASSLPKALPVNAQKVSASFDLFSDGFSAVRNAASAVVGAGDRVAALVDHGLALAAEAAPGVGFIRGALERLLGRSARDEIGWIQELSPPTQDRTATFETLYAAAKAGETILPAEAKDHVYLTLRGYTGDNFPRYMRENREGLAARGLDVREIPTDTEQTVAHNAKVVRDAILEAAKDGKQVVLIGHSKGGLDMTAAVALYPELRQHVRAAVAMQSPYGGVPIATDLQDQRIVSTLAGKSIEWVLRGDDASIPDFSYAQRKAFVAAHPWPADIPTVSLATSSDSQLNGLTPVINWYRLRYGEQTDGIVAQRDSEIPGSSVVKLDNLDHLNSVMPEFPGRANWDPGLLTEALVALALEVEPQLQ